MNVEQLLELLVCPKCHGKLSEQAASAGAEPSGLACPACALVYALHDGLPNMLIGEALPLRTGTET